MQPNRPTDTTVLDAIQGHGYTTAHMLTRQAWQQEAMAAAEQERLLREAGLQPTGPRRAARSHRLTVGLGGVLIRLGTHLQGAATAQITDPAG